MSDLGKAIPLSNTVYDISNIYTDEEIGSIEFVDHPESRVIEVRDEDDPIVAELIELGRQFRNL